MARVTIYTTVLCPYCARALKLLDRKGVAYEQIDVTFDPDRRKDMAARAGSRTVPQIFVDDRHIGDSTRLLELDAAGELDGILGVAA